MAWQETTGFRGLEISRFQRAFRDLPIPLISLISLIVLGKVTDRFLAWYGASAKAWELPAAPTRRAQSIKQYCLTFSRNMIYYSNLLIDRSKVL